MVLRGIEPFFGRSFFEAFVKKAKVFFLVFILDKSVKESFIYTVHTTYYV